MMGGRSQGMLDEQAPLQSGGKQPACRHDDHQNPSHHGILHSGLA